MSGSKDVMKNAGDGAYRFIHGFATAGVALGLLVVLAALAIWSITALGGPVLPSPFRIFQSGLILTALSGVLLLLLRVRGTGR